MPVRDRLSIRHGNPKLTAVRFLFFLVSLVFCSGWVAKLEASPEIIAPLIDPVKLDALNGDRAANSRLRKITYWLEADRRTGLDPGEVIETAQKALGCHDTARSRAVLKSLIRNLVILERLGCLDEAGMGKLRRGKAPKITRGPYSGDIASVDHIIPRSVAPGLDKKLYNLEFMPSRMNNSKGAKIGQRQTALAMEWYAEGLILEVDYRRVISLKP